MGIRIETQLKHINLYNTLLEKFKEAKQINGEFWDSLTHFRLISVLWNIPQLWNPCLPVIHTSILKVEFSSWHNTKNSSQHFTCSNLSDCIILNFFLQVVIQISCLSGTNPWTLKVNYVFYWNSHNNVRKIKLANCFEVKVWQHWWI